MTRAKIKAITIPPSPPNAPPAVTRRTVKSAIKKVVFSVFILPSLEKQKGQLLPCEMNWPAFKRVAPKGLLSNGPTGYLNIEGSGLTRLLKKSHVVILRSLRRRRISIFLLQILR